MRSHALDLILDLWNGFRTRLGRRGVLVGVAVIAVASWALSSAMADSSESDQAPAGVGKVERSAMDRGKAAVKWPINKSYWACDAPIWPADIPAGQARQPGNGQRVLILGDSLTHNIEQPLSDALLSKGWLPTIDCYGGKDTLWGADQLRELEASSHVPSRVVVALGINESFVDRVGVAEFSKRVNRLLDALGPDRTVWWVNLWANLDRVTKEGNPQIKVLPQYNAALSQAIASRPNLKLVDWARSVSEYVMANGSMPTTDGIHYEQVGNDMRINTIVSAL